MENQTKINELESKLNSVFGDINKYYSDFNQKVSLFLFNKELLNENSLVQIFQKYFSDREFNVEVTKTYLKRIFKDYDITISDVEEYKNELIKRQKKIDEQKKKNRKKLIFGLSIIIPVLITSFFVYDWYSEKEILLDKIYKIKSNNLILSNHKNAFKVDSDSIIILNKESIIPSKYGLKPSYQFCCYSFIPDKELESTFKKPITQFTDTTNLINYNPKENYKVVANKILRQVETENKFQEGVGGYLNGNYGSVNFFRDENSKWLTNYFLVFDENIINYFGNDSIEIKFIENDDVKIKDYINNEEFKRIKISGRFFNKLRPLNDRKQPKSFKLKLYDTSKKIEASNLPLFNKGQNEIITFSPSQEIYIVDYIISGAYQHYYGVLIQDKENHSEHISKQLWRLWWVDGFRGKYDIIPTNTELPIKYNMEIRKKIILQVIDQINKKP